MRSAISKAQQIAALDLNSQNILRPLSTAITIMCGLALISFCLLSSYRPIGILSLIVVCFWLAWSVRANPLFLYKYLAFIYMAAIGLLGCAFCEYTDIYLEEVGTYAHFVGSLPLLVFAQWVFFAVLFYRDARYQRMGFSRPVLGDSYGTTSLNVGLCILFAVICAASFVNIFPYPFFATGLGRVAYASSYLTGIWGTFNSWMSFLFVIPVMLTRNRRTRLFAVACLILYILYLLWIGTKFGPYLNLLTVLVIVYYGEISCLERRVLFKMAVVIIAVLVGMVVVGGLVFTTTSSAYGDVTEYLFQRGAMQGQLWWKTYEQLNGSFYPEQLEVELAGITAPAAINQNVDSDYGIYHIMRYCAPANIVSAYLSGNCRFTEAGFATALYCLGSIGVILFSIICSCLVCWLTNLGIRHINTNDGFITLCWGWTYQALRTFISMGTLNVFVTTTGMVAITLLAFDALFHLRHFRSSGSPRKKVRSGDDGCGVHATSVTTETGSPYDH